MKREMLREAIDKLDDELIQDADLPVRRRPVWRQFAALAACLVLVIGGTALWSRYMPAGSGQRNGYALKSAEGKTPQNDTAGTSAENAVLITEEEQAMNQFGYRTAAELLGESGANMLYSPVSLYYALAMTAEGAAGQTQAELLDLLKAENPQSLADLCQSMYEAQYTDEENSKLKIANSIWLDASLGGLNPQYADLITNRFFGSLFSVDFTDSSTSERISEWIASQTNGLVQYTPQDTGKVMSLINTVYFKDRWTSQFREDNTQEADFILKDGEKIRHEFMNGAFMGSVYEGDGFTRSSLNMEHGSMVFILPQDGRSVQELTASAQSLETAFTEGEEQAGLVYWHLPKFSYDTSLRLSETVQALGAETAFGPEADFTQMTENGEGIYISSVTQNTHISLSEGGVEAAAYTEVAMARGAMAPSQELEMNLDRPFLYGILDDAGTLIFIGVCLNPEG